MPLPTLRELTQHYPDSGRVVAIYLRPARGVPMASVAHAIAEPGRGLMGDRRSARASLGEATQKREVTLIQSEHLPTIGALLGQAAIDPARLRRNIVVSGINLLAMRALWKDLRLEWQIGEEVVLQVTGTCDPCSRMEDELGHGGYNAMRGHGGVTARLISGGTIRVGDAIRLRAPQT